MTNKRLLLLLMVFVFGVPIRKAQAQVMTQNTAPLGATPDNKMLGGSSVGAGLSGISAPDLFNGSTNINVPIFNFSNDGLNSGVSLSYNTQGVKVDEFASPVGLHWNLNYGGEIVRNVRDIPDELLGNTDSLMATTNYINGAQADSIANKEMHIYGRLFAYSESAAHLTAFNAYEDKESDEFAVSLMGIGFKFYIGKNLKIFTTSPRNYKIRLLADSTPITDINQLNTNGQHTLNFKITDNQGNQFYFSPYISNTFLGRGKFYDWDQVDKTPDGMSPDFEFAYPTNWRLKSVILANGQHIDYNYAASSMGNYNVDDDSTKTYLDFYVGENIEGYSPFFWGASLGKSVEDFYPLTSIAYPDNTKVSFQYDSLRWNGKGNYLLKEIKISSLNNCKRFHLYQESINGRYYLDSISQVSCDGTEEEPYYQFTYNNLIYKDMSLPGQNPVIDTLPFLPRRLNNAQDLYGYYNGDSTGSGIGSSGAGISIPKHVAYGGTTYGNERQYDAEYAIAGLLHSVKNAYGEEERFIYGPNIISSIPLSNIIPTDNSFFGSDQPDGVRIDSIIKTDPYHPYDSLVTTFNYSGGQIFMPGGYFHYPTEVDSASNAWTDVMYQSMFLTAHQLVNGSNHGYSGVDVKNYAGGALLSRRVITYTNMQDGLTGIDSNRYYKVPGSLNYFQYPYTNKQYLRDWEIGLPLTVTDYDQNNRIVKKTINDYDFSAPDLSASSYISDTCIAKVNSGTYINYPGYYDWFYPHKKIFADPYYPFKGIVTLNQTVTQKYVSDTRYITDTVWYAYDGHHNLSSTITQDSKGDKTATSLIYNYNVDGSPSITGLSDSHPGTTLYNMTDSGLEVIVSTERWKLDPSVIQPPINNSLESSFITRYQYQGGKLWTKGLLNTDIGNPLSYSQYTGYTQGGTYVNPFNRVLTAYNTAGTVDNFIRTSTITLFDTKGNPNETQLLDQNQYKAMIWDTASGLKLAEAANCRYGDIAYTSFENNLEESNFTVSTTLRVANAVTGTQSQYLWTNVSPGTAISVNGTQSLKAGTEYLLSFWVYGAVPTVKVGVLSVPLTTANLVYTKGGWHNYQVRFTPSAAGKIKITGTAALSEIDEIRLFPANAQMQSWTYQPLFGKSSYTDPSGRVTYYRYDKMGRRNLVLDQDGNILSKTDYHVAQ